MWRRISVKMYLLLREISEFSSFAFDHADIPRVKLKIISPFWKYWQQKYIYPRFSLSTSVMIVFLNAKNTDICNVKKDSSRCKKKQMYLA